MQALRRLLVHDFEQARYHDALKVANLGPRDVSHRFVFRAHRLSVEVSFFGQPNQVHWNVLYFCMAYGCWNVDVTA